MKKIVFFKKGLKTCQICTMNEGIEGKKCKREQESVKKLHRKSLNLISKCVSILLFFVMFRIVELMVVSGPLYFFPKWVK